MASDRDTLKEQYRYNNILVVSGSGKGKFKTDCFQFLEEHDFAQCFRILPLKDILNEFLKKAEKKGKAEFLHLLKIFQQFEKYAAHVLSKPWCKDFFTIKVYTGFFKYHFEQCISLDTAYRVLKLIGYAKTSPDTLTLETPADVERALTIGFELYLAHTQLYILKSTEYLSSEYLMKDIMEGWFNTTGSPRNILEWIGKNKIAKEEVPGGNKCYLLNTNVPDETTRSKSVTVYGKHSHYNRNGHLIDFQVKYPPSSNIGEYNNALYSRDLSPGFQGEMDESSNYHSLAPATISDNQLYGEDDESQPYSMPHSYSNEVYEALVTYSGDSNATYKHNTQTERTSKDSLNSKSRIYAVARGGNSQLGSSRIYQNTTTDSSTRGGLASSKAGHAFNGDNKDIVEAKERCDKILANRIQRQSPLVKDKNFDKVYTSNDLSEADQGSVSYGIDFGSKSSHKPQLIEGHYVSPNSFSDLRENSGEMMYETTCKICGRQPSYACRKCKEIVCNECFESIFKKRPCLSSETGHDCYRVSNV